MKLFGKCFIIFLLIPTLAFCFQNRKTQGFTSKQLLDKVKLDSTALRKFPPLYCSVSNNGNYSFSFVRNQSQIYSTLKVTLIKENDSIEFSRVNQKLWATPAFTADSKKLIFIRGKDSLCIYSILKKSIEFRANVKNYLIKNDWLVYLTNKADLIIVNLKLNKKSIITDVGQFDVIQPSEKTTWLNYKTNNLTNQINLKCLESNRQIEYRNVSKTFLSDNKNIIIVETSGNHFTWQNLVSGISNDVPVLPNMANIAFDKNCKQLVFTCNQSDDVWYYKEGATKSILLISADELKTAVNKGVIAYLKFNSNGNKLIIQKNEAIPNLDFDLTLGKNKRVKIWNYKDEQYPLGLQTSHNYWIFVDLKDKKITKSLGPDGYFDSDLVGNKYLTYDRNQKIDSYYRGALLPLLIDVSSRNAKDVLLDGIWDPVISPSEKYVVGFNTDSLNWCSYQIATGKKRNISKFIPYPMYDPYLKEFRLQDVSGYKIAGWSADEKKIYLYDQYDIWEVDLEGKTKPICITKGFARKAGIVLGIIEEKRYTTNNLRIIRPGDELICSAYRAETKESGFWKITVNKGGTKIEQGAMKPWAFYTSRQDRLYFTEPLPVCTIERIGDSGKFLLTNQDANSYPNYFLTDDFKNYKQLTNYQPQIVYNWLTSELLSWELPNGKKVQGVLYKPENFDSTKKYPVIFTYYQGRSTELHLFRDAAYTRSNINIPYFVSNGYLVFVPDIYIEKGKNTESVVQTVTTATKILSQKQYIDSQHIGLEGHSMGGWETNVLITHTQNVFAAACEVSGMSDLISMYDEDPGHGNQPFYESDRGQLSPYGIGITPWTNLGAYAHDSPLLYVDTVTTPLLQVHGEQDLQVPFSQGLEMFLALKRAGKKVWLLHYQDNHSLEGEDQKDFTIRLKQFFDHYLKGEPAPKWMTTAVDLNGRKEKVAYELDPSEIKP